MVQPNWILQRTKLSRDAIALVDLHTQQSWTYRRLETEIMTWVDYLTTKQLKKGDRIVIVASNRIELFPILFACGLLGIIYVPLNNRLSTKELEALMQDSGASLLFYDDKCTSIVAKMQIYNKENLEHVKHYSYRNSFKGNIGNTDPWLIIYTGGTTGKLKGVVLAHESINENAINTIVSWNLSQRDITINYMPLFHTGGLNALCIPILMAGGTVIIGDEFDAEAALRATDEYQATISLFVPTMYHLMTQTSYFKQSTFPSMDVFLSGGAPCPTHIYKQFKQKGLAFKEGYGLTEAGPNNFFIQPELANKKVGSVGKSMLFNEIIVVSDDGKLTQPNEVGELLIKGKHVFKFYWNLEAETKATFSDGWLKTGDLAKYDEDGDFYIVGRKKDMIISGGENIYPQEIEQYLYNYETISEAAVIGVTDIKWGEIAVAFFSTTDGASIQDQVLNAYCQQYL